MPSPNQKEKDMDHVFFNIFDLCLENEVDSIFMGVLNDIDSNHGTDTIDLFTREDIRSAGLNLSIRLAA